jgi:transposase
VRTGVQWRMVPDDLPPWTIIYQQAQRWIRAQCFQVMIEDLRMLLREFAGSEGATDAHGSGQPHAAIDAGVWGAGRL